MRKTLGADESVEGVDVLPSTVANDTEFGVSDINVTAFLLPRVSGRIIWAVGPRVTIPNDRRVVPVGGGFGKLFREGRRPVNLSLSAYDNIEQTDIGAE